MEWAACNLIPTVLDGTRLALGVQQDTGGFLWGQQYQGNIMIPKIIHFIYPWTERTRPWSLVNTLSVRSAIKTYPDHKIIMWTNAPTRVPMLPIEIQKCEIPSQFGGVQIEWPQYVSDVMRLDILYEYGGIYMDTDIISVRPFTPVDEDVLTISWEDTTMESVCNAFMVTPPGNLFIKTWLDKMPEALTYVTWAYGGVVLPKELALNCYLEDQRSVIDHKLACPLDLKANWMFDPKLKDAAKEKIADAYNIHIFETFWRDIIKDITPEWTEKNDCLFSELFKAHRRP
jgi:hypothetical protein